MRVPVAGGVLLIAGLAVSACDAGQPQIFSLKVGDCVNLTTQNEGAISSVPVVPCDQPHRGEVFAETRLPDGEYPGQDVLAAQADTFCREEFQKFIGVDYDSSALDMTPIYPVKDGWDNVNDRTIQCIVVVGADTTGTLRGANR